MTNPLLAKLGTPLSPREKQVLEGYSQGKILKEIAKELGISHYTVKNHCQAGFVKLGVHTQAEAVHKYYEERRKNECSQKSWQPYLLLC
jgi:DNA-binding CsgD family transcriptional regulator